MNEEEYQTFIGNPENIEDWKTYFKWSERAKFQITSRSGRKVAVIGKLMNYLVVKTGTVFRYLMIEQCDNMIMGEISSEHWIEKTQKELKILKIIKFAQWCSHKESKEQSLSKFKNLDNSGFKSLEPVEDDRIVTNRAKTLKFNNKFREDGHKRIEIKLEKEYTFQNESSKNDHSNKNSTKSKIQKLSKEQMDSQNSSELDLEENGSYQKSWRLSPRKPKAKNILKKKKKNKTKSQLDSQGSSIIKRIRLNEIERFLHKTFKPNNHNFPAYFSFSILVIILIVNLFTTYVKRPVHKVISSEIENHTLNADFFSWEIWSLAYPVIYTDICRSVKEGWVSNELSTYFLEGMTMFENCHKEGRETKGFQLSADNMIDVNIRSKKLSFYDLGQWTSIMIKLNLPKMSDFDKFEKLEDLQFDEVEWPRRGAIKYLDVNSDKVMDRDYENDTELVEYFVPWKRYLDYEEFAFRRNLMGDALKKYWICSYQYYQYLKLLGRFEQNFIFVGTSISILVCLVFGFLMAIFVFHQIRKMRVFYRKIFQFKVKFIDYIFF